MSALFAGLLTKVGVYALIRTFTLIVPPGTGYGHDILLVLAILTMVLGVLGAAAQSEFRRVLSFHIISQVGYMVLGLALASKLALAAVVFYLAHHIVVKANLFLVGGLAVRLSGKENLYKTGGLARISPWLAVAFIIPAFSLAGLPPLSGFVAKLGIVEATVDSGAWISLAASLAVGLFTLYSMMKIWYEAFWKDAPEGQEPITPTPETVSNWGWRLAPCLVLALITVMVGLGAGYIFEYSEGAAEQLLNPTNTVKLFSKRCLLEVAP